MMQAVPSKPELFAIKEAGNPALKGCRCACGHVFFPRNEYGCEACGNTSEKIENIELSGEGEIRAFAKVHQHHSDELKPPFVVATIVLKEGCAIRALLDVRDEKELSVGQTVFSSLVEIGVDEQGRKIVDLRFKPQR